MLRYIAGPVNVSLLCLRSCPVLPQHLCAPIDDKWVKQKETRKSTSAFAIAINGSTYSVERRISRKSGYFQQSPYISRCLIALNIPVGCAKFSGWFLFENQCLRGNNCEPRSVQIKSSAVTGLELNKKVSARTNLIDLKHHFLKAALKSNIIVLKDVKLVDNSFYMLMKVFEFPSTPQLSHEMLFVWLADGK